MAKQSIDRVTGEIRFELPKLRSAFDRHDDISRDTGLKCEDESLASQSSFEESDINVLVRRFGFTGQLPTGLTAPTFGDFSNIPSYQEALNALVSAKNTFMALPANIRSEFDNDPHRFVAFCSDDANYDRIMELGLLAPKAMQKRQDARKAAEKANLDSMVDEALEKRLKAPKEAV